MNEMRGMDSGGEKSELYDEINQDEEKWGKREKRISTALSTRSQAEQDQAKRSSLCHFFVCSDCHKTEKNF